MADIDNAEDVEVPIVPKLVEKKVEKKENLFTDLDFDESEINAG